MVAWVSVALYLFGVNGLTFIAYGIDKSQAPQDGYRIPERTLLALGLLGGNPAAFAAQRVFRHKTRKDSFQFRFWLTVALQAGFGAAALYGAILDRL
jgi:uncharacterized membrane protein YsdA (DUF1294 family)